MTRFGISHNLLRSLGVMGSKREFLMKPELSLWKQVQVAANLGNPAFGPLPDWRIASLNFDNNVRTRHHFRAAA